MLGLNAASHNTASALGLNATSKNSPVHHLPFKAVSKWTMYFRGLQQGVRKGILNLDLILQSKQGCRPMKGVKEHILFWAIFGQYPPKLNQDLSCWNQGRTAANSKYGLEMITGTGLYAGTQCCKQGHISPPSPLPGCFQIGLCHQIQDSPWDFLLQTTEVHLVHLFSLGDDEDGFIQSTDKTLIHEPWSQVKRSPKKK